MELLFDVGGLLQTWVDQIGKVLELTTTAVVDGKLSDAEKSSLSGTHEGGGFGGILRKIFVFVAIFFAKFQDIVQLSARFCKYR